MKNFIYKYFILTVSFILLSLNTTLAQQLQQAAYGPRVREEIIPRWQNNLSILFSILSFLAIPVIIIAGIIIYKKRKK